MRVSGFSANAPKHKNLNMSQIHKMIFFCIIQFFDPDGSGLLNKRLFTNHLQQTVKLCWKERDTLFPLLFFPKATNQLGMAGLLTYSLFAAFPSLARETVATNGKQSSRAYSSGHCPGFSPGSLFIPKPRWISGTNTGIKINFKKSPGRNV